MRASVIDYEPYYRLAAAIIGQSMFDYVDLKRKINRTKSDVVKAKNQKYLNNVLEFLGSPYYEVLCTFDKTGVFMNVDGIMKRLDWYVEHDIPFKGFSAAQITKEANT